MAPITAGKIAQSYQMFYLGPDDPQPSDAMEEVAILYPGYKPLLYQTAACSSWPQLKSLCENKGLLIHQISTEIIESLTCDEFEAKWLHPNQVQLARDPLEDRKLEGWYDDEGYAFCHRNQDDHVPPTYKLSRVERDQRAEDDLEALQSFQSERTQQRLRAINEMAQKRKAGRARRKASRAK